eukprot:2969532-Ditylum_brightwellii.AAC.1
MASTWNIQVVGTCKANRKRFASDELQLEKHAEQGDYMCLVDDCICIVITRWNDSKALQTISTITEVRETDITQCVGQEIITVGCSDGIVMYPTYINAVDKGDKHHLVGA